MKKKQSKLIITVVLIASGLLGVIAIGLALYLNYMVDDDPTPNVQADQTQNKCESLYVKQEDENGELVTLETSDEINPEKPIIIGSRFQSPKGENNAVSAVEYVEFHYLINNDTEDPTVISSEDPKLSSLQTTATLSYIKTEFEWNDYESLGDSSTLQVSVIPYGYPFAPENDQDEAQVEVEELLGNVVGTCLPLVFNLDKDPIITQCLEAGETGVDRTLECQPDAQGNVTDECTTASNVLDVPKCCSGLVRVDNCAVPDKDTNICEDAPEGCFICLSDIEDGICSETEGENVCNSPEDCAEVEEEPADDPTDDPTTPAGTVQCDGACTVGGSECASGFVCQAGKCKDVDCPTSTNPMCACDAKQEPTELTCQTTCDPDSATQQCGAGATCMNTGGVYKCVNEQCPTDGDCTCDTSEPNLDTSNFTVTNSGPTCLERISPNNVATFKITVSNSDEGFQEVLQVKNKLPLGFTFTAGSAKINGEADTSDTYVTITPVGDTQEVVWTRDGGWTVAPSQQLVIEFSAIAGSNALTGDAMNEVVITPSNTALNADSLRTSFTFKVAQTCSTPETGLLDSTIGKAVLGLIAIVMAGVLYFTSSGNRVAENVHSSGIYRTSTGSMNSLKENVRISFLRLTEPRKSFEEKVERDIRKKSKK